MATREEHVIFQLNAMCRYDEEVQVFVGYLPRLQIYSQGRTEEELADALRTTALRFIVACSDKHILPIVMREGGLQAAPSNHTIAEIAANSEDFVAVLQYRECEQPIEVSIPMSLIAQRELASA